MSFSLGSLNPISFVADAAEKVCDAVLPKKLEFVGDLASGALNALGGNFVGVAEDAYDLGQNIQGGVEGLLKGGGWKAALDGFCKTEPEPPARSGGNDLSASAASTSAASAAMAAAASAAMAAATSAAMAAAVSKGSNATSAAPASGNSGKSEVTAKTESTSHPAGTGKAESAGKTDAGGASGLDEESRKFLDSAKTDPEAFMKAIREGRVPDEILDSKKGMMMLQTTMEHIQAMNQLMTQLLKVMHDMQMATIQNIRA